MISHFPINVKKTMYVFIVLLTTFFLSSCETFIEANDTENTLLKNNEELDLSEFWEVYNIIEEEYFTASGVIKKEDLVNGAIAGMVEALEDQHSEFMDPELTKKFNETLEGDFEGIGAVVEKVPLGIEIERVLKGSPAKKYDVRAGDIVVKAGENELQDLGIYEAIDKIKGPAGSTVTLTILRIGEEDLIEIDVVRDRIQIPSVESEILDENIGYISLNMFGESTAQEFRRELENIRNQDISGLILDVRDNGGGYLGTAVEVLSEFIPEGELLVQTRYKDSFLNTSYSSFGSEETFDQNIVVLINRNSASASEITAGALREYDKAILVGEQSYGKGSVQQPFSMSDGSLLKLTVAKWFTPEGRNIEEEGVEPDIEVSFTEEDYDNEYDRQLEEAKKILTLFNEEQTIALTVEAYERQREEDLLQNEEETFSGSGSRGEE